MKNIYRSFLYTALFSGFLLSANAQSGKSSSSGSSSSSSGSHSSGGGASSGGGVRSSGGGSVGVSRPAGSMMGQRVGNGQGNRMGGPGTSGGGMRPSYGYSPRVGNGGIRANFVSPQRQGPNQNFVSHSINTDRTRIGVSSQNVNVYRTNTAFNHGHADFWGGHNYYFHNRGYYKTGYLPHLGFTCTVLPYGYYPFFWGDAQYYYSDGLFYEYENDQYTVVEPPIGAEVTSLPEGAQSIVINGQQYYEANGVYYQPYTKDNGTLVYVVAGKDGELNTNTTVENNVPAPPQIGDIVNQLPPNCRKITVSGQKLYVSPDGIYYQPIVDANNVTTYKIVGLPSDQMDSN